MTLKTYAEADGHTVLGISDKRCIIIDAQARHIEKDDATAARWRIPCRVERLVRCANIAHLLSHNSNSASMIHC